MTAAENRQVIEESLNTLDYLCREFYDELETARCALAELDKLHPVKPTVE